MKIPALRFQLLAIVAVVLATTAGCGQQDANPATTVVSGVVKFKGKPLANATIVLSPVDSTLKTAAGKSDANGEFTLTTFTVGDGAIPGKYRIAVSATKEDNSLTQVSSQSASNELADEEASYTGEAASKPPVSLIPKKYQNALQSGLTCEITSEATPLAIDLK